MNCLIKMICGSKAFGLDTEGSDTDFLSIVSCADETLMPHGQQVHVKTLTGDYFLARLDDMYQISGCASPLVAPYYNAVCQYENALLYQFISNNNYVLAEIAPNCTYRIVLNQVERYLEDARESAYKICARLLGLMWGRYYIGDMLSARNLSDLWRRRFFDGKYGIAGKKDVEKWLQELKTRSIRDYFSIQPANYTLHDQYKLVIDQVLKETAESMTQ